MPRPLAPLLEFRGAVATANGLQVGEQQPCRRQPAQHCLDFITKMNHRQTAGFLAGVGNGSVGPVNVFRLEIGDVGLRTAEMPAQFVKAASLRVLFPINDELMFFAGNGALLLEAHFRPEALWNERPRQPVHGKAEVVKFPQMDVGADRARLEAGEQVVGLRFQNHPMANVIQCGFFRRPPPAILG